MIGIDKLATELAEHAPIKVVYGEHASAPAVARFEHNRFRAGGLQTIGRGQPGDAAADNGDRVRSVLSMPFLLLGVSAPLEDGSERGSARGCRRKPQQFPPRQCG